MPFDEDRPLTIVEALAAVMDEVQSVSKDQRNTHQHYNFRGIDAVVNAVGPALRKYGVVCVPTEATYDAEHYETKNGANMRGVTIRVTFRFYGPAGDFIEAQTLGESADSGDKAVPKAHSVAYRTLLLQALCIPTDEPDPDSETIERAERRQEGPVVPVPTSWPKVEAAVRSCDNPDEAWALWEAFLRAATYHVYGQTSLKDLASSEERKVMLQKAGGAAVWMQENVQPDGAFHFYTEEFMRKAWAGVLDGHALEIPDYVPAEPPGAEEEVERIAAEVFGETPPA